jgi:hypothetical protein
MYDHPPYTNYELVAEDSINEKTHALEVEAGLKLSLLVVLIIILMYPRKTAKNRS